jgi:hypothetical protein
MSGKENRFEPVEDALFALMMDEFMKKQGEELLELNEALKAQPDDEELAASKERCQKTLEQHFKERKAARRKKHLKTVGRVLIAAILSMVLVTATAFAASESFRVYVLNLMIDVTDSDITFHFGRDSDTDENQILSAEDLVLGWLPEGFEETNCIANETKIYYEFTNEEEAYIGVTELDGRSSTLMVSRDNTEVQNIEIGGHSATLVEYDDTCEITWADEEKILFIDVCTEGVSLEVALKIAENLIY